MDKNYKSSRILLNLAGVLSCLLAVKQTVLYVYANAHWKEILKNGPARLFGFLTVTESAAFPNPSLIVIVFCVLIAMTCFFASHKIKKHTSAAKS